MADVYILGICGTFMGGVAALAREQGQTVGGCDAAVYPPMSDQLRALGIQLDSGYGDENLPPSNSEIVVGNALSRGKPIIEAMLRARRRYTSGPQWLGERILPGRRVAAVAGTHGKTTTASLLAHLLEQAGQAPGFLIGGVPGNFETSARLGSGAAFVVEADEYDSAYFDKRSKFVHYRPEVAVLNNLEFDHADIFPDIAAIQRQFHHLVRTVPPDGQIIVNGDDAALADVLAMGCWTPVTRYSLRDTQADFSVRQHDAAGSDCTLLVKGSAVGRWQWSLRGQHNVANALAAVAAAQALGVAPIDSVRALTSFRAPRRRLEQIVAKGGITIYDDFAHHPTAIAQTLAGMRAAIGSARLLVALEPRSNTMRAGVHAAQLAPSLALADSVHVLAKPGLGFDAAVSLSALGKRLAGVSADVQSLHAELIDTLRPGDHLVLMSNGAFDGLAALLRATYYV